MTTSANPPVEHRNGFGITALVVGIVAVIFGFLNYGRLQRGTTGNRVMSLIGTFLGMAAAALGIWGVVTFFSAVGGFSNQVNDQVNYMQYENAP